MTAEAAHNIARFVLGWCFIGSPFGAYTLWIYGRMHDEVWVLKVVDAMRKRGKTIDEIAAWVAQADAIASGKPYFEFLKAVRNMLCWPWMIWRFRALYTMQVRVWLGRLLS